MHPRGLFARPQCPLRRCAGRRGLGLHPRSRRVRPHFVKSRVKVRVYPGPCLSRRHALFHRPLRRERNDQRCEKRRLNPLGGETLGTAWTSLWLAHPAHRRTKTEEADIPCATKTAQLNSLSTEIAVRAVPFLTASIQKKLALIRLFAVSPAGLDRVKRTWNRAK